MRCSYSLMGLPPEGNCPECGTPIADSLRGFYLRFAAPEYIAKVRTGLSLILNGILLMVAMFLVRFVLPFVANYFFSASTLVWIALVQLLPLIPSVIILLGYWRYTEPDPGFVGVETPHAARKILRVATVVSSACVLVPAALALATMGSLYAPGVGGSAPSPASSVAATTILMLGWLGTAVGYIAWAVQFFAAMKYTTWLAARIPDGAIEARARLYLWLLPVIFVVGILLIIGPLVALIMYWNLLDKVRKHVKAIAVAPPTAPLLPT